MSRDPKKCTGQINGTAILREAKAKLERAVKPKKTTRKRKKKKTGRGGIDNIRR
jgi:hypothetical protein